jgi:FtsH-binding integral membrane protein
MTQAVARRPVPPASRFSPRPAGYAPSLQPVALRSEEVRAEFITRTYSHLFGAVLAFTLLEIAYFKAGLALPMARAMLSTSWLLVLGGFVLVSWLASRLAHVAESPAVQYAALGGYVVAESIIFVPLLLIAQLSAPGVIQSAAAVTLFGFTGLTVLVFATRKDFSFLGGLLGWCGVVALLLIVSGSIFGFELGTFFSVAMIALAGGAVLHDTSKVLHHFPEDRYVAAALELFASIALMFWYVLRLYLSRRR